MCTGQKEGRSGSDPDCCTGSEFCNSGTCDDRWTCATNPTTPTDREVGDPCSRANSTSFPRFPGDGTGQTCNCKSGQGVCSKNGALVTGGTVGTCCQNSVTCNNTTWMANCRVQNECNGNNIECCDSTEFCNGSNDCQHKNDSCSGDWGYTNGGIGTTCGVNLPVGDGTTIDCNCATSNGRSNNTCNASSGSTGTCVCTPDTCGGDCRNNGDSNGCGGNMSCGCGSQVCNPQ